MKYCSNCGEEVDEEAVFCPNCGEDLSPEYTDKQDKSGDEKSDTSTIKKLGYWGGRIVQFALVGLAAIFVLGGLSMNILQFVVVGIFAIILIGFAGAIEILIVRPSSN